MSAAEDFAKRLARSEDALALLIRQPLEKSLFTQSSRRRGTCGARRCAVARNAQSAACNIRPKQQPIAGVVSGKNPAVEPGQAVSQDRRAR